MNKNKSSFLEDDWLDDLSDIQNELDQTEVEEIEFLCKDYLKGELIPISVNIYSLLLWNEKNSKFKNSKSVKFLKYHAKFWSPVCLMC